MFLFRSQKLAQRRLEIEMEYRLAEMKFTIENPPKYTKGQVLEDGTVISNVGKIMIPEMQLSSILGEQMGTRFSGWHWTYEGVKDGKIVKLSA